MKSEDWSAVIVMSLTGLVCLYFATDAIVVKEVICLGRGCARSISLFQEPKMFYLNVGGLLFLASVLIGWSIRIIFGRRNREMR
jgi:hypothetical protein